MLTPDGAVWSHEHGPQGGDELNRLVAGENYGWPVATFGIDYNGARISPFERYPGMRDSAWHWTPSIGPSGLAYVPTPDAEAQGTFYLGGLAIPGLYAAERRGIKSSRWNSASVSSRNASAMFESQATGPYWS